LKDAYDFVQVTPNGETPRTFAIFMEHSHLYDFYTTGYILTNSDEFFALEASLVLYTISLRNLKFQETVEPTIFEECFGFGDVRLTKPNYPYNIMLSRQMVMVLLGDFQLLTFLIQTMSYN